MPTFRYIKKLIQFHSEGVCARGFLKKIFRPDQTTLLVSTFSSQLSNEKLNLEEQQFLSGLTAWE